MNVSQGALPRGVASGSLARWTGLAHTAFLLSIKDDWLWSREPSRPDEAMS